MKKDFSREEQVELLAPAADFLTAKAAIDAGADAVYMGGPAFGARARAGNSMEEVGKAVRYAHRYAARCYLTLNTLVYEEEIGQALALAWDAYRTGVDALLLQDLGLIEAGLPPMELHASTQCHVDSVEKALFLQGMGFKRLVLARELSLAEIRAIAKAVEIEVEAFIHGALCVCYSGQCYMSCYLNGRSGNRGDCAQSCRLPYSLTDAEGRVLVPARYLLSMKDLNADSCLEEMIAAGVSSLKIEGRLKDAGYVRNVVAYYRRRLDGILEGWPAKGKASQGDVRIEGFTPDIRKSFHRPYTRFNLLEDRDGWAAWESPKATGEEVGKVVRVLFHKPGTYSGLGLEVEPFSSAMVFSSGDGICYKDRKGTIQGGLVEKAVREGGNWVLCMAGPENRQDLPAQGASFFRNRDAAFEKKLHAAVVERTLPVRISFDTKTASCRMEDGYGNKVRAVLPPDVCLPAAKDGLARENFARQLSKLGGTAYRLESLDFEGGALPFVPASALNGLRRELVSRMDALRQARYSPQGRIEASSLEAGEEPSGSAFLREGNLGSLAGKTACDSFSRGKLAGTGFVRAEISGKKLPYRFNCANSYARKLYESLGAESAEPAFELEVPVHRARGGDVLMTCKYCIRAQLGKCLKRDELSGGFSGDLFLRSASHKFALHFDCAACRMEVRSCAGEDS